MSLADEPHGRQRVRIVHRDDDDDGDWTVTAVSEPIEGCSIQPQPGSETYDAGQRERQPWLVIGPPELAAARSWDALDLELVPGSDQWERVPLIGRPRSWPGDHGAGHVEITVAATRG